MRRPAVTGDSVTVGLRLGSSDDESELSGLKEWIKSDFYIQHSSNDVIVNMVVMED